MAAKCNIYEPLENKSVLQLPGIGAASGRALADKGYKEIMNVYHVYRKYRHQEKQFHDWMRQVCDLTQKNSEKVFKFFNNHERSGAANGGRAHKRPQHEVVIKERIKHMKGIDPVGKIKAYPASSNWRPTSNTYKGDLREVEFYGQSSRDHRGSPPPSRGAICLPGMERSQNIPKRVVKYERYEKHYY